MCVFVSSKCFVCLYRVYIYVSVYAHIYMCAYTNVYVYIYTNACVYIHIYTFLTFSC